MTDYDLTPQGSATPVVRFYGEAVEALTRSQSFSRTLVGSKPRSADSHWSTSSVSAEPLWGRSAAMSIAAPGGAVFQPNPCGVEAGH
jgi:hypothetical protein